MEAYERRMTAMRTGEFVPPPGDSYDFEADMRALSADKRKKEKEGGERESYLSREQLMELRRVQNERVEVCVFWLCCIVEAIRQLLIGVSFLQVGKMKLLGMDVKQNFGVRMEETDD